MIIGAGIAGAGMAYRLAPKGSVAVLDMEAQAGYHTTGRSAAFYAETYGGPKLQPLTTASKGFFRAPPEGFSEAPLQGPLGAIHIFREDQREEADAALAEMSVLPGVRVLPAEEVLRRAPYLKPDMLTAGIDDPDCANLDVAALHQGYLKGAKAHGAQVLLESGLESAVYEGGRWQVKTRTGALTARVLINTAGAWADQVAERAGVKPLGVTPLRRTIVTFKNPQGLPFDRHGPVIIDVGEAFYFKPEGEGYMVSPADETPSVPTDAQPELEDIAVAVDHFERVTGATVEKLEAKWAGLRTFAPDRAPVIGFDADQPAFFWSVGQGGYGIQTSPAWSALAATLVLGEDLPEELKAHGVRPELYSPARFR
ncbi:NAD(P)/FAD-dependent oxidoreductase [Kordiimonas marina]|uniref:NAD(P)/FAD-dependent oxidoreductase n=1 Tax=Kordiimonas marina TaxID=2872312 RepID=UPI001FF3C908|nr:FAD-binding oxidoreductase [Kordiimonas marina]